MVLAAATELASARGTEPASALDLAAASVEDLTVLEGASSHPGCYRRSGRTTPRTRRRRGLKGEVLLEIVVQRDGTVGDVRILQGLGDGLDQSAVEAVRQWRFAPARRLGAPVDVLVEVAVEFRLR